MTDLLPPLSCADRPLSDCRNCGHAGSGLVPEIGEDFLGRVCRSWVPDAAALERMVEELPW